MRKYLKEDIAHVFRMCMNNNLNNRITEELIVGVETGLFYYLARLPEASDEMAEAIKPLDESGGKHALD